MSEAYNNGRFHARDESVKVVLLSSLFLNVEISSLRTTGARESALSWFNLSPSLHFSSDVCK